MKNLSQLIKIYIGLIITLVFLAAINVFLPFPGLIPTQELPASKPVLALVNAGIMIILYGGLRFLRLKLSQKLGFLISRMLFHLLMFFDKITA